MLLKEGLKIRINPDADFSSWDINIPNDDEIFTLTKYDKSVGDRYWWIVEDDWESDDSFIQEFFIPAERNFRKEIEKKLEEY